MKGTRVVTYDKIRGKGGFEYYLDEETPFASEQLWIITKMGRKNMSCFTKTDYDTEWKENGMTMAIRGVSFLGKTAKNTGMKLFGLRQTENKNLSSVGGRKVSDMELTSALIMTELSGINALILMERNKLY